MKTLKIILFSIVSIPVFMLFLFNVELNSISILVFTLIQYTALTTTEYIIDLIKSVIGSIKQSNLK